jgi:hypothetical protein
MYKLFSYKASVTKKLLIFMLLFSSCMAVIAQDEEVAVTDTTYAPAADEEMEQFDSLTFGDTPFYKPRPLHDSLLENLKKDEAFWYVNAAPQRKKVKEPEQQESRDMPFYVQQWFRTLVWIIIIAGFVAVLVWFLIASDVRLFRKKPAVVQNFSEDILPEDIFSIQYDKELEKATAEKNYHLGVRLMYLHILKLFAERDIIDYRAGKTNSDYLFQVYDTPYHKDFFRLTRNFEYVWYGQFAIAEPAYVHIKEDYATLKSRLL